MPRTLKALSRFIVLCAVTACVSGCSGWVERQVNTASRAIDCAVLATAQAPTTAETVHCERHPAAKG